MDSIEIEREGVDRIHLEHLVGSHEHGNGTTDSL
jgi:hypothetical protein